MKRSLIAVPLLSVAGWAGATLYAGQETQSSYDQLLDQLRIQHGLQVEPLRYEKNFLSSTVRTVVNGKSGSLSQSQDLPAPFTALAERFVLIHEIEHGPVVLSNGLQALAGRIKTTIDMESIDPDLAQAWQQACSCAEPLVLQSELALQGGYSHELDIQALDWQDGDQKISFGGLYSESRVDADKMATSDGQTGALHVQFEGGSIDVAAGQWQMKGREEIKNIVVGDGVFSIPSININSEGTVSEISGLRLDLQSDLTDGKINSLGDVSFNSIKLPNFNLEDTHLDIAVTGFPAANITTFTEGLSNLDLSSNGHEVEILTLYRDFIAPGVGIRYGLRGDHSEGGKFNASLEMSYQPGEGVTFDDMHAVADLVDAVKAEIDVAFDEALLTQFPNNPEQNPMLGMAFKKSGSEYTLRASLLKGAAELNDSPVPISMMFANQLAQPLPSIEAVALALQSAQ